MPLELKNTPPYYKPLAGSGAGENSIYGMIKGMLTQTGTNAPVLTLFYNNTIASITTSYVDVGHYKLEFSPAILKLDNTWIMFNSALTTNAETLGYTFTNEETLDLYSFDADNNTCNDAYDRRSFEIIIMPEIV